MFLLFNLVFGGIAALLDNLFGTRMTELPESLLHGFFYLGYFLAILIPGLAVIVRRLHDIGKSGWWFLINLVPIIGFIWFLALMVTEGDLRDNKYGPNPKEMTV